MNRDLILLPHNEWVRPPRQPVRHLACEGYVSCAFSNDFQEELASGEGKNRQFALVAITECIVARKCPQITEDSYPIRRGRFQS